MYSRASTILLVTTSAWGRRLPPLFVHLHLFFFFLLLYILLQYIRKRTFADRIASRPIVWLTISFLLNKIAAGFFTECGWLWNGFESRSCESLLLLQPPQFEKLKSLFINGRRMAAVPAAVHEGRRIAAFLFFLISVLVLVIRPAYSSGKILSLLCREKIKKMKTSCV